MSGGQEKGGLKVLPNHELSQAANELDRTAVARIAKNAANAKLAAIYQATSDAKELKQVAAMAEWAGDQETEDSVLLALKGLAAAATI
jgi:hypothetical protein